jgi:hypothetical protein
MTGSLYNAYDGKFTRLALINLLNDGPTCRMLMSGGLRKLIFAIPWKMPDKINTARLIVERLPQLHMIELHSSGRKLPIVLHTLINGLSELKCLISNGAALAGKRNEARLRDLQTPYTRSFRAEVHNTRHDDILLIWL